MKLFDKEELQSKKTLLIISCLIWFSIIAVSIWYFGNFNFLKKRNEPMGAPAAEASSVYNKAPSPKMGDKMSTGIQEGELLSNSAGDNLDLASKEVSNKEKFTPDPFFKVVPIVEAPKSQLKYSEEAVFLKKINIKDLSKDVVNYNDFKVSLFKKSSSLKSILPKLKDGMSCSKETFGWSEGNVQCLGEIEDDYAHGTSYFMNNKAPFITGEANVICNNGTWVLSEAKFCAPIACPMQRVKWLGGDGKICQTMLPNSFVNSAFTSEHMGFEQVQGVITAICTQEGWQELEGAKCLEATAKKSSSVEGANSK